MTIKNAALISLIAISAHGFIWFCEIMYKAIVWGFAGWQFLSMLYLILFDGSMIFFLSVVYYNHNKKEKMNQ
tara:strand:+ start:100 stop:315 length:216 start_codon:yes stop_codon:yes gene_type:complete